MANITSVSDKREIGINSFFSKVGFYISLLKPRVMSLSIFTSFVGMIIAPGFITIYEGALIILAISIGSGASGALNMWYERKTDLLMERTKNRVLPMGLISSNGALIYGITLSVFSIFLLYYVANFLSASILLVTILYYIFVYTVWLKKRTPQNIVIGGIAGAMPPLLGWSAVTGTIEPGALILVFIIFAWTPPHFWALAIHRKDEYAKSGVPMLPVTHGEYVTKLHIIFYLSLIHI